MEAGSTEERRIDGRNHQEAAPRLFGFEVDLYPSLRCIPMAIRYKLDLVGMKVPLKAWNRLPLEQRLELLHAWPVDAAAERQVLRERLSQWLQAVSDEPLREIPFDDDPPWQNTAHLSAAVEEQGAACQPPLTLEEWASFELLERFALVKLATAKHERGRFSQALAEFRRRRLEGGSGSLAPLDTRRAI